jgi:hypothetical protein
VGVHALGLFEAGACADVGVPARRPPPLRPFAGLPAKCLWDKRQLDGRAVGRQRRFGTGHEVVGVDDDRAVSPGVADCGVQLMQRLKPDLVGAHLGSQRMVGRCDFLGATDQERVPGLGEEAPVGEDFAVPAVGRVLEEHADVMGLITEPRQERHRRIEPPAVDVGFAIVRQVAERFMETDHVTALDHRAEEDRGTCPWCGPQCEHRHRPQPIYPAMRAFRISAAYKTNPKTGDRNGSYPHAVQDQNPPKG